jgi:replication factor A1
MTSEIEKQTETTEEKNEIKIKDLEPKMSNIATTFKIVEIGEPREVNSRRSYETHRVADAIVGDETGIVKVPLWNESIDEMKVGKTYRLEDGYTGLFRGNLQLKIGRHSKVAEADEEIESVNNDVDMSSENHRTSRDRYYYPPRRRSSRGYRRHDSYGGRDRDRYSRQGGSYRRRW